MRNVLVGLGLLVGVSLSLACAQAAAPIPAAPDGGGAVPLATRPASLGGGGGAPTVERGKQLMTEKGCIACHAIKDVPGAVGNVGPALDGLAGRPTIAGGVLPNGQANLRRWLNNPPGVKPGTLMPNLGLNAGEIDSLIEFLGTLK